jgi:hypothetical protein
VVRVRFLEILALSLEVWLLVHRGDPGICDALGSLFWCCFSDVANDFPEVLKIVKSLSCFSMESYVPELSIIGPRTQCLFIDGIILLDHRMRDELWLLVGWSDPLWHVRSIRCQTLFG